MQVRQAARPCFYPWVSVHGLLTVDFFVSLIVEGRPAHLHTLGPSAKKHVGKAWNFKRSARCWIYAAASTLSFIFLNHR